MIQQEEYCLSIKQAYRVEGFSNTMVDDIVHGKIQQFINQMGPFYQAPSEEKPVNDKNCPIKIYTSTSTNAITM